MIYGCVCMICRYGIYLDRDDDEDGVGAGVEERDGPERGIVQLVRGRRGGGEKVS